VVTSMQPVAMVQTIGPSTACNTSRMPTMLPQPAQARCPGEFCSGYAKVSSTKQPLYVSPVTIIFTTVFHVPSEHLLR